MDVAKPGAKVLNPVAALIGSNETHLTEPARQVIRAVLDELAQLHECDLTLQGHPLKGLVQVYQLAKPHKWTARLMPCASQISKSSCSSADLFDGHCRDDMREYGIWLLESLPPQVQGKLSWDASGWWGLANVLLGTRGQAPSRGPYGARYIPASLLKLHPALRTPGERLQRITSLLHTVAVGEDAGKLRMALAAFLGRSTHGWADLVGQEAVQELAAAAETAEGADQVQKDQAQILRRQTKTAFDLLRFLTLWGTVSALGLHILGLEEPAALEDKAKAIEQVLPGTLDVMAMFSHPNTHVWQSLAWEFLDTCIGRAADRPLLGPGNPPPRYFVKPPADDLWSEVPVESAPAPGPRPQAFLLRPAKDESASQPSKRDLPQMPSSLSGPGAGGSGLISTQKAAPQGAAQPRSQQGNVGQVEQHAEREPDARQLRDLLSDMQGLDDSRSDSITAALEEMGARSIEPLPHRVRFQLPETPPASPAAAVSPAGPSLMDLQPLDSKLPSSDELQPAAKEPAADMLPDSGTRLRGSQAWTSDDGGGGDLTPVSPWLRAGTAEPGQDQQSASKARRALIDLRPLPARAALSRPPDSSATSSLTLEEGPEQDQQLRTLVQQPASAARLRPAGSDPLPERAQAWALHRQASDNSREHRHPQQADEDQEEAEGPTIRLLRLLLESQQSQLGQRTGIEQAASPSRRSQQAAAMSGRIRPSTQLTHVLPRSTSLIGSTNRLSRTPMAPPASPMLQPGFTETLQEPSRRTSLPSAGDQPVQGQVMDDRLPLGLSLGRSGPQSLTMLRQQGSGPSSGRSPSFPPKAAQRSSSLAQSGGLTRAALGLALQSQPAAGLAADLQQTFDLQQPGQERAPLATAGARQSSGSLAQAEELSRAAGAAPLAGSPAAGLLRRARSEDLDASPLPLSALVPEPFPAAPVLAPQASAGTAQPRRVSTASRNSSLGCNASLVGQQPSHRVSQKGSRSSGELLRPPEDPAAAHAAVSQPLFAALALAQGLNAGLGSLGPRDSIPDPTIVRQLLQAAVAMQRRAPAAQTADQRLDDAQRSLNQLAVNNEALVETLDAAEDTIALLTPILESSSTSYFTSNSSAESVQPRAYIEDQPDQISTDDSSRASSLAFCTPLDPEQLSVDMAGASVTPHVSQPQSQIDAADIGPIRAVPSQLGPSRPSAASHASQAAMQQLQNPIPDQPGAQHLSAATSAEMRRVAAQILGSMAPLGTALEPVPESPSPSEGTSGSPQRELSPQRDSSPMRAPTWPAAQEPQGTSPAAGVPAFLSAAGAQPSWILRLLTRISRAAQGPLGFTQLLVAVLRLLVQHRHSFQAIAQQLSQAQRVTLAGQAGPAAGQADAEGPTPPPTPHAGIGESSHHTSPHGHV